MPKTRMMGRNCIRGLEPAPPWASASRVGNVVVTADPRSFSPGAAARASRTPDLVKRELLSGDGLRPARCPPLPPRRLPGDGDGERALPTLQPRELASAQP